ncbi:hypothetical protein [Lysinibacillus odysseyi]|nr:hypothetical protein [Lysinibacillus odysseyi]
MLETTYDYPIQQSKQKNPDKKWKELISSSFEKHEGRYGYHWIHTRRDT